MNYIVVFTKTTAFYIENNQKKIRPHLKILRNPIMDVSVELSPTYWKMGRSNIVVPMTLEEQQMRDAYIREYGHDLDVFFPDKEYGAPLSQPAIPHADPTPWPEEEITEVIKEKTHMEKMKDHWKNLDKEALFQWSVIVLLLLQLFRQ